jgi:hypothetical protein
MSTEPEGYEMDGRLEDGGWRHYLAGRPVHAGDQLRLWQPGGWVWARFETRGDRGYDGVLYLAGDRVLRLKYGMRLRWPESWER